MWYQSELYGSARLLENDVPGAAVAKREGWRILPQNPSPVSMPRAEDDVMEANFVLFDDPTYRDGDILWEIEISNGNEVIALASLSEMLAGADENVYTIGLDKIFVHPEHRLKGIGQAVVDLMSEVLLARAETVPSIDLAKVYMNIEPASPGGEALADKVNLAWQKIVSEASQEPAP